MYVGIYKCCQTCTYFFKTETGNDIFTVTHIPIYIYNPISKCIDISTSDVAGEGVIFRCMRVWHYTFHIWKILKNLLVFITLTFLKLQQTFIRINEGHMQIKI